MRLINLLSLKYEKCANQKYACLLNLNKFKNTLIKKLYRAELV